MRYTISLAYLGVHTITGFEKGEAEMEKGKIFVRTGIFLPLIVFFTMFVVMSSFAQPARRITLNYVSFMPLSNFEFAQFRPLFIDRINEKAKGELIINVRGGPEVIPAYDLAGAAQKGTIDMTMIPTGFLENIVPGADATRLSELTPFEERKTGAYDYILEQYKKAGLYYLGRQQTQRERFFYLFTKKRCEKPQDFVGLKLTSSPSFHALYKGLGATVTHTAMPEYYSALEKGVVDGLGTSLFFWSGSRIYEVTKYAIDHPFYTPTPAVLLNLNSWNRLPKHLQNLLTESLLATLKSWPDIAAKKIEEDKEKGRKAGVEFIKLSPDVAKWFIKIAYEEAWKDEERKAPEVARRLRKLLTK
jgi:TRAP-type C4-dicarboxylate transport system substrate-binding protein